MHGLSWPGLAVFAAACVGPVAERGPGAADPVSVVERQLLAYNARDVDAFCATYDDDVVIGDVGQPPRIRGQAELRRHYGEQFVNAPRQHAVISNRIVQGAWVVDHEQVHGRPDGERRVTVAIYRVRNGRIAEVWFLR